MVLCDTCNVWVKAQGLGTHMRQKHQILQNKTPLCAAKNSMEILAEIKQEIIRMKKITANPISVEQTIDSVISRYLHEKENSEDKDLVTSINTINLQMEKMINRIQNIENILRF
jgi:hypothetical protein